MIRNHDQLIESIKNAGIQLQDIQNYIGPIDQDHFDKPEYRINFPYGYIRPAANFRFKLQFIKDKNIQTNLSYALQLSDLFCWLLNRLNLWGIVKQMVIKNGIILMASISESISVYSAKFFSFGLNIGFNKRITRMENKKMISSDLRKDLQWLWDIRANIHIYEIKHTEYKKYSEDDYIKAVVTTRKFVNELNRFFRT